MWEWTNRKLSVNLSKFVFNRFEFMLFNLHHRRIILFHCLLSLNAVTAAFSVCIIFHEKYWNYICFLPIGWSLLSYIGQTKLSHNLIFPWSTSQKTTLYILHFEFSNPKALICWKCNRFCSDIIVEMLV